MKAVRQASLLAWKDIRQFVRDRWALAFAIAFPLVFLFGFSLVFQDVGQTDEPVEIVLATEEGPASLSQHLIDGLVAGSTAHARALAPAEARAQVDAGTLSGYLLFPQGFSETVTTGGAATIRVIADPDSANTEAMLAGVAQSIAIDLTTQQLAVGTALDLVRQAGVSLDPATLNAAIQRVTGEGATQAGSTVAVRTEQAGAVEAKPAAAFILPGYITMFVFFAAGFSAEQFIRERDNHTLDRLLASGVSGGTILAGKWLGTVGRAIVQSAVLWVLGVLFFHVDIGRDPLGAVLVTLGMIAASASFALFLASIARTARSASSLVVLSALIMAPLGGSWWPLFIMPRWMQMLARITPHAWANDAFNRLMIFGAALPDVWLNLGVLLAFAAAFGAAGFLRVRVRA